MNHGRVSLLILASFFAALTWPRAAAAAPLAAAATGPSFAAAADAWATTYLLNLIFLEDFLSSSPSSKDSKGGAPAAALLRARFAAAIAQDKKQRLTSATRLSAEVRATDAKGAPDLAAAEASFANADHRRHFSSFAPAYALDSPSCGVSPATVSQFASHQMTLLHRQGPTVKDEDLLRPLSALSPDDQLCVALVLMATADEIQASQGFEPAPLLTALARAASPKSVAVRAILAARLIQQARFGAALEILVGMQEENPSFRLAYDLVQRIYSRRHVGRGDVALGTP